MNLIHSIDREASNYVTFLSPVIASLPAAHSSSSSSSSCSRAPCACSFAPENQEMALSVLSPSISCLYHHSPHSFRTSSNSTNSLFLLLRRWNSSLFSTHNFCCTSSPFTHCCHPISASSDQRDGVSTDISTTSFMDEELLRRVSSARDADQALDMIAEAYQSVGYGTVEIADCHSIIAAAFDRGNTELALSMFHAMRSGFSQGGIFFL